MHSDDLRNDIPQFCAIPFLAGDQIMTFRQGQQTCLEFAKVLAFTLMTAEALPCDREHGRQIILEPVLHLTKQSEMKPLGCFAICDIASNLGSADDMIVT